MTSGAVAKNNVIPPEFGLALACCKSALRGSSDEDSAVISGVDWPKVVQIARFHRIEGLVWNELKSSAALPEVICRGLLGDAESIAASNLRAAAECRDLAAEFEAAGIALLFLKGLTLGVLAYGNPSLKSAIDVDLLIDRNDLARAAEQLRSRGYRLLIPTRDAELDRWHRHSKESVWVRDAPALQIDLHTRLADSPHLIPTIDVHSPGQSVDVGSGIRLSTLADEELFAYLTVHGAWAAWFRLKWIADLAGLVQGRGPSELERLYERSQQLGAGRAAGQALLLADRLFGTLVPATELRREIARDRTTRLLCNAAVQILLSKRGEPTARRFGTVPIHLLELLLLPGLSYKVSELRRQASSVAARLR